MVLTAVGTVITSLGVVRERQEGTLEQLAVMPLRPRDVIVGKIAPYFLVGIIDMVVITAAGLLLFDVPFRGSWPVFIAGALLFLLAVLGVGVLISTVSQTQGEAIQLAIMTMLPQVHALRDDLPADLDALGGALDLLPAAAHLLHPDRARGLPQGHPVRRPGDALPGAWPRWRVVVLGLAVLRFRPGPGTRRDAAGTAGRPRRRRDLGVAGLTVSFGSAPALEGITLEVPPGRVTAVVGGDGAGKTTLLRVMAGLLAPPGGRVRLPGAGRIGYLPARVGGLPRPHGRREPRVRGPGLRLGGRRRGPTTCWSAPAWPPSASAWPATSPGACARSSG